MPSSSSPIVASHRHPGREFDNIKQVGLKTLNLALMYQAAVESRLPAGVIAGLQQDLTDLGVVVPAATQARLGVMNATEMQNQALARAMLRVKAVRRAVRSADAPSDVRHAYGVGRKGRVTVNGGKVAIQQILDRLAAHPEEAVSFGILPADVAALEAALGEISTTAEAQDTKRASAPRTTRERNVTANRVLKAVKRVASAGVLAFSQSAVERGLFEAIRLGPRKGEKKRAKAALVTMGPQAAPNPGPAEPA